MFQFLTLARLPLFVQSLFQIALVKGRAPAGVAVGAGGHDQLVRLGQLVAVAAVQPPLQQPQQEGGDEGHGQVTDHLDGGGLEVHIVVAHDVPVDGEKFREADDEHHRGVLDVDDEVVADLGDDVPEGLGQDDAGHGLHVGHADGLGPLGLARVDGQDAAPDGLRHVGPCVDGHDDQRGGPHAHIAPKLQGLIGEIGQAVEDEHRLKHHGRAPEHLHIDADDHPDELEEKALHSVVLLGVGDGVEHAAGKADDTADQGSRHRQDQGVAHSHQVLHPEGVPQPAHVHDKFN